MNKKNFFAILLILLLAAASVLGLPLLARSIERRAENSVPAVTASPVPVYDDIGDGAGA